MWHFSKSLESHLTLNLNIDSVAPTAARQLYHLKWVTQGTGKQHRLCLLRFLLGGSFATTLYGTVAGQLYLPSRAEFSDVGKSHRMYEAVLILVPSSRHFMTELNSKRIKQREKNSSDSHTLISLQISTEHLF